MTTPGGSTATSPHQPRTRINEEILAREIRLIGADGAQIGIVSPTRALQMAQELQLDLVEIAPQAQPPVCKIMDFGKFRYELQKKEKLQKKNQQVILIKEVRFHPNIDTHDFDFKVRHARQFLLDGNKVKASIVFKGRQMAHQEFGVALFEKLKENLNDLAVLEKEPAFEGRAMIGMFAPDKKKLKLIHNPKKPEQLESSTEITNS